MNLMTYVVVAATILAAVTVAFQVGVGTGRAVERAEIDREEQVKDEIEEMIAG